MREVGFEPTSANTFGLEPNPLDRSGTRAKEFLWQTHAKMSDAGFEPASISAADLKSAPLDHSGIRAFCS